MHAFVHAHRPTLTYRNATKTVCLPDLIKADCGSEGADLGYKSKIPGAGQGNEEKLHMKIQRLAAFCCNSNCY